MASLFHTDVLLCAHSYSIYGVSSTFCIICGYSLSALFFFLMIRRPPRSTLDRSSAASDVYKRQVLVDVALKNQNNSFFRLNADGKKGPVVKNVEINSNDLSLIHISEPTRPY